MEEINNYIKRICEEAKNEGRELIIWGYAKGGHYLKYLVEHCGVEISIAYIIDAVKENIYGGSIIIHRCSLLNYIDVDKYVILSTVLDFNGVNNIVKERCKNKKCKL